MICPPSTPLFSFAHFVLTILAFLLFLENTHIQRIKSIKTLDFSAAELEGIDTKMLNSEGKLLQIQYSVFNQSISQIGGSLQKCHLMYHFLDSY